MIRKQIGAAMALLAVLGIGVSAHADRAYRLNPENSSFTATGEGTVSENGAFYACTVSMSGTTDTSSGSITGLTFSGPPGCENVIASGLPWKFVPISLKQIQITHVDLMYPTRGRCGPSKVNARLGSGMMSIRNHLVNKMGICKISADLAVSPALSITNK